jgi:hypothetical protein
LKGLEVFDESLGYWRQLKQEGRIEDFQVVLLYPHASDLEDSRCCTRRSNS